VPSPLWIHLPLQYHSLKVIRYAGVQDALVQWVVRGSHGAVAIFRWPHILRFWCIFPPKRGRGAPKKKNKKNLFNPIKLPIATLGPWFSLYVGRSTTVLYTHFPDVGLKYWVRILSNVLDLLGWLWSIGLLELRGAWIKVDKSQFLNLWS